VQLEAIVLGIFKLCDVSEAGSASVIRYIKEKGFYSVPY
jgi:hypothetical protein